MSFRLFRIGECGHCCGQNETLRRIPNLSASARQCLPTSSGLRQFSSKQIECWKSGGTLGQHRQGAAEICIPIGGWRGAWPVSCASLQRRSWQSCSQGGDVLYSNNLWICDILYVEVWLTHSCVALVLFFFLRRCVVGE